MLGPGYFGYVVCLVAAALRAAMHWVTPTPGNGAGCCALELPTYLVDAFDVDGDGSVTLTDLRLALRAAHRRTRASVRPVTYAVFACLRSGRRLVYSGQPVKKCAISL